MVSTLLAALVLGDESVKLADTRGIAHTVIGDRLGRATVTFVVMKDCPIARKFTPEIKRIWHDYDARGVKFFLVFCDQVTRAEVNAHLGEFGITLPGIIDPGIVRKRTGAQAVPTASMFSPSGKLMYSGRIDDRFFRLGGQRAAPTRHDLRTALDQFLSGKPVVPARTTVIGCALPQL